MVNEADELASRDVERITDLLYASEVSTRENAARGLIEGADPQRTVALMEDGLVRTSEELEGTHLTQMLERWSDTLQILSTVGRSSPASPLVQYALLTRIHILVDMLGDYDEGILWGRTALEQLPNERQHVVHGDLAIAHSLKRQNDLAEQHIRMAIELISDGSSPYWLARHHGNYGAILARAGRFAEADEEFATALNLGEGLKEFDLREKFEADQATVRRALAEERAEPS